MMLRNPTSSMYETFQSRALTSYKRLSRSQIDGETAHLGGAADICCMLGALGDLLIRVLRRVDVGLEDSLSDALMMMLTVSSR
jgi:hypothetical protein